MKKELHYCLGDEEHDEEYTYEVDYDDIYDFIVELFANFYGIHERTARIIIGDFDLWETLEEDWEEDILNNWYEKAMAKRDDDKAYKNKYSYYGIKESDFH